MRGQSITLAVATVAITTTSRVLQRPPLDLMRRRRLQVPGADSGVLSSTFTGTASGARHCSVAAPVRQYRELPSIRASGGCCTSVWRALDHEARRQACAHASPRRRRDRLMNRQDRSNGAPALHAALCDARGVGVLCLGRSPYGARAPRRGWRTESAPNGGRHPQPRRHLPRHRSGVGACALSTCSGRSFGGHRLRRPRRRDPTAPSAPRASSPCGCCGLPHLLPPRHRRRHRLPRRASRHWWPRRRAAAVARDLCARNEHPRRDRPCSISPNAGEVGAGGSHTCSPEDVYRACHTLSGSSKDGAGAAMALASPNLLDHTGCRAACLFSERTGSGHKRT